LGPWGGQWSVECSGRDDGGLAITQIDHRPTIWVHAWSGRAGIVIEIRLGGVVMFGQCAETSRRRNCWADRRRPFGVFGPGASRQGASQRPKRTHSEAQDGAEQGSDENMRHAAWSDWRRIRFGNIGDADRRSGLGLLVELGDPVGGIGGIIGIRSARGDAQQVRDLVRFDFDLGKEAE
jgi:hypothetical protein